MRRVSYDSQTRVSLFWNPANNVAQQTTLMERQMLEREPFSVPQEGATDVDFGESSMSGMSVHGLRRTQQVVVQEGGTRKPITITDEYWYAQDLHLIVLEKHDDPRTGEQIVDVTNIARAEPDAKVFAPPQGYRIVDVTPDSPGSVAGTPAGVSTPAPMQ